MNEKTNFLLTKAATKKKNNKKKTKLWCRISLFGMVGFFTWIQIRIFVLQFEPSTTLHHHHSSTSSSSWSSSSFFFFDKKTHTRRRRRSIDYENNHDDVDDVDHQIRLFCSKMNDQEGDDGIDGIPNLWKTFIQPILIHDGGGLRHPKDIDDIYANWTQQLLEDHLTSHVLEYSIKGIPHPSIIRSMMIKLIRQMNYYYQQQQPLPPLSNKPPPPLKIVVFGGSAVQGVGCQRPPKPLSNTPLKFALLNECAWPYRLEYTINHVLNHYFFKYLGSSSSNTAANDNAQNPTNTTTTTTKSIPFVQIFNLAVGGTNSDAAVPILRYGLSPILQPSTKKNKISPLPDVIINAYSTNDHLPPAFHGTMNTTIDSYHFARVWKRIMTFVNAVSDYAKSLSVTSCPPTEEYNRHPSMTSPPPRLPFTLFVNDYLGNQQQSIIGDSEIDHAYQWLADFDETVGYSSIKSTIKRWVLADTTEEIFSAPWKIDRKTGKTKIDVHFGEMGHITTTIGLLYYFFKVIVNYREDIDYDDDFFPDPNEREHRKSIETDQDDDEDITVLHGTDFAEVEIPSMEWIKIYKPPIIQPNITEHNWNNLLQARSSSSLENERELVQEQDKKGETTDCDTSIPLCAFAFLAAPFGTHSDEWPLSAFLEPYTLQNDGWAAKNDLRNGGWQNKLGLVALKPSASMTLSYPNSSHIKILTMHYLKSYGDLWKDSKLQIRAQVVNADTEEEVLYEQIMDIEGYHDQPVSIGYTFQTTFDSTIQGEFRLQLNLIGGRTFKVTALMWCR